MDYPHQFLTISLLDDCNKACKHCYRTAIPSYQSFKLNKTEVQQVLDDASSLKTACVFTGGECTIWQDNGMDFLSLFQQAVKQNGRAAFLSNGFVFEDKNYTDEYVRRYVQECGLPMQMWFTVDFLHGNYDSENKRILFLENIISARNTHVKNMDLKLFLISHWTNDDNLNIPKQVFEAYEKEGVEYAIDDYMMWGRAAKLDDLSCYLQVGSSDKTNLGPYRKILIEKMISSAKIEDEGDFDMHTNRELLSKLSVCGKSPNNYTSWGNKYYYCIPQMGYDWFAISELGNLRPSAVDFFYGKRPIIREIQELSIFGVLDKYRHTLDDILLRDIESMRESIRFAGCSVCLKLSREGILQEINQKLLDQQ
jgi:hypothetical protein